MSNLSLNVATLYGNQETTLRCPSSASVAQLKVLISQWQATDPTNVVVMLRGRSLDNDSSLSSEGLKDGSKLNVVVKGAKFERMHSMPLPNIPKPQAPKTNNTLSLPRTDTMPLAPTDNTDKLNKVRPAVPVAPLQPSPDVRVQPPSEPVRPAGLRKSTELHGGREKPALPSASSGVMARPDNDDRPKGPPNQPREQVPTGLSKVLIPNSPKPVSSDSLSMFIEMGFPKSEAQAALERANGDIAKAISLLMGESAEENRFEAIQKQIRKRPELLEGYIENLKQSPQVQEMEKGNPGFIRQLLTDGINTGSERDAGPLNQADLNAIKEVVGTGFTDQQVMIAYLAAERDVERAVNALLG